MNRPPNCPKSGGHQSCEEFSTSTMSRRSSARSSFLNSSEYLKSGASGLPFDECACSTDRSSWLGHQSWLVCGLPAFGVGESIAGFSLSLPWAAAESCATGQPASALRSTPCGLVGPLSWVSLIYFLPDEGSSRDGCGRTVGAGAPVHDLRLVDHEAVVLGGGQTWGVADGAVDIGDGAA